MNVYDEFEMVIGLEVHCQLATDSKIFSRAKARLSGEQSVANEPVNQNTTVVCTAQPGTLPVLNRKSVDFAILAGLATNSTVKKKSVFSRKHYFYPDLPKGYQITQFDLPICEHGHLDIETSDQKTKRISITRIHMEEDAGKNLHLTGYSLVNLNRAGVPLIEIVSGPDMRSPEEAGAYLRTLYGIVTYLGVCDGNLQEGNFRCDANVSVRRRGAPEFGTRCEIKNVNSFRFVEKAIEYEAQRQIQVILGGGTISQETRGFDSTKNQTFSMRSKEEAHDYRYFPEPDLPALILTDEWIERMRARIPELPHQKKARYLSEFGLGSYDAGVITNSKVFAKFFEECVSELSRLGRDVKSTAKTCANLLTGEIARLLNDENIEISETKLTPKHIAELVVLQVDQVVSSTGAKTAIVQAWKTGEAISTIVESLGLKQVSDLSALEPVIEQVIAANAKQAEEYRSGKDKLLGFFVGQVMKQTGGKANPALLQDLVKKKLASGK